jgi:hypothetical protein
MYFTKFAENNFLCNLVLLAGCLYDLLHGRNIIMLLEVVVYLDLYIFVICLKSLSSRNIKEMVL